MKKMSAKEFRRAVRKCKVAYAWVSLYADEHGPCDGEYMKLSKTRLLQLSKDSSESLFCAEMRGDDLYIN